MGTVSPAGSFGGQLEALVVQRFARAAEDELARRCAGSPAAGDAAAGAYRASLRELGGLAPQRLQGLCVGLLDWRAAAVRTRRGKELPEPAHEGPARVVDELLAEGLGAVMPVYAGSNLDSEYADSIENILLDLVKAASATAHCEEPDGVGRHHVAGSATAVLASLSTHRLLVIVGKVQAAVKLVPAADKSAALRFMQLLGSLQLRWGSSAQMLQSAQTLRILSELAKEKTMKCSSQECRHAALAAAAKLLLSVRERREARPAGTESSPWRQELSDLWDLAMSLRAKPKHALPALRLLSALVSVLPAEDVDSKASALLKGHLLPALAPARGGGVMNKMMSAAGIGAVKGAEDPRLVALQALEVVMGTLQGIPSPLRVQSSTFIHQVGPALKNTCDAVAALRDQRDCRDIVPSLTAVAAILCLPAIPASLSGWDDWQRTAATRAGLYPSPAPSFISDGTKGCNKGCNRLDLGGWSWCISLISSLLLPSLSSGRGGTAKGTGEGGAGGGSVEAFVAGLIALERIVSCLSLVCGRTGQVGEREVAREREGGPQRRCWKSCARPWRGRWRMYLSASTVCVGRWSRIRRTRGALRSCCCL
jgi:hypothetical protein